MRGRRPFAAAAILGLLAGCATAPPPAKAPPAPPAAAAPIVESGGVLKRAGALGPGVLHSAAFWWCVAGIAVTGALNLGVSFWLAMVVALRSRGVQVTERSRILGAIRRRLRSAPLSFLWPPKVH